MHRTITATMLAAVLALGGLGASTTQARADSDDTARALAGIVGLAIIGNAIAKHNRDKDKRHATRRYDPYYDYYAHERPRHRLHRDRYHRRHERFHRRHDRRHHGFYHGRGHRHDHHRGHDHRRAHDNHRHGNDRAYHRSWHRWPERHHRDLDRGAGGVHRRY